MSWRSESPFTVGFRAYVGFWFHCSPNPVNAIAPGEIETSILSAGTELIVDQQIPMHRLGKPEEVASLVHFLCTRGALYINGSEIHVNGGQHV